mgnify:CR=1 FL=1
MRRRTGERAARFGVVRLWGGINFASDKSFFHMPPDREPSFILVRVARRAWSPQDGAETRLWGI